MFQLKTPVASAATDPLRARPRRPRTLNRHARVDLPEIVRPADFDGGQFFTLARDAMVLGNLENGRVVLWNPAAEQLLGWSAAEAIGRPLDQVVPEAIIRLHRAEVELSRRSGQARSFDTRRPFELVVRARDGREVRVELSAASVLQGRRPGQYLLAQLREVSASQLAETGSAEMRAAERDSAREDAERAVRRHHELVHGGLADLRRELERLQRSADALSRRLADMQDRGPRARADVVGRRAERLRRNLDILAASSELEAHTLELNAQRVNLVPLVSRVAARTRARGKTHKVNVAAPQGLTALVDVERFEQVIDALLEQAVARNPRGCWIDLDLRRPLVGQARLEVRDFGRAVSEETRRHLRDGGADLGMALVRSIVDLHGGQLSYEFPPDGGVRAIVTLPTQRGRVASGL
jgi:PAS domain S-box-containing protein